LGTVITINSQKVLLGNPNIEVIDASLSAGSGSHGPYSIYSKLKLPLGAIVTAKNSASPTSAEVFSISAGSGTTASDVGPPVNRLDVYSSNTSSTAEVTIIVVGYQV
jgi:hypothetical protein